MGARRPTITAQPILNKILNNNSKSNFKRSAQKDREFRDRTGYATLMIGSRSSMFIFNALATMAKAARMRAFTCSSV